jgi:hypothetical protein
MGDSLQELGKSMHELFKACWALEVAQDAIRLRNTLEQAAANIAKIEQATRKKEDSNRWRNR